MLQLTEELAIGIVEDFVSNMNIKQIDHSVWNVDSIDEHVGPTREEPNSAESTVKLTGANSPS